MIVELKAQQDRQKRRVMVLGAFAPSLIAFRGAMIAEMVRRGYEVFAASPGIDIEIAEKIRALGAIPVPVQLARVSLNPLRAIRTINELKGTFRRLKPDVVIAYTISPVILGAFAARAARIKHFVAFITGLGYAFTGGREPKRLLSRLMATLLYRRALEAADIAIFQNEDDRREFRRLRLLPETLPTALTNGSGVDLDHFSPAPLPDDLSFLMVARLLKDKGLREFAEAAKALKREHPDARFALAGWIDASPNSISRAELISIAAAGVDYLGRLEDVRPAIASAGVYVLPSYREGTPRSVLEAMAMGRAIITTDAPGCRETVVEGQNGFLVEPRDAEALLTAMRRFAQDPGLALRMGAASRQIAEEKYDVRKVTEELLRHVGL